jgi:hypothetical protein
MVALLTAAFVASSVHALVAEEVTSWTQLKGGVLGLPPSSEGNFSLSEFFVDDYDSVIECGADKMITIMGNGATITGNGVGRFFTLWQGATFTMSHATLRNGSNPEFAKGGAIAVSQGSVLTILSCTIAWCSGSAIFFDSSWASGTISRCVFLSNAGQRGAAIHGLAGGDVHIEFTNFTANGAAEHGGGVYWTQGGVQAGLTLHVRSSVFTQNTATNGDATSGGGGAIYCAYVCRISDCEFVSSSAAINGGAVQVAQAGSNGRLVGEFMVIISASTFVLNVAKNGAALHIGSASVNISDCGFDRNTYHTVEVTSRMGGTFDSPTGVGSAIYAVSGLATNGMFSFGEVFVVLIHQPRIATTNSKPAVVGSPVYSCNSGTSFTNFTYPYCEVCASGKYSLQEELESSCQPCAPGEYQDLFGQSSCSSCGPGRFSDGIQATACKECPPGKHGATSLPFYVCQECPSGQYQQFPSQNDCTLCPAGVYGATSGLSSSNCSGTCPKWDRVPARSFFRHPAATWVCCQHQGRGWWWLVHRADQVQGRFFLLVGG